MVTRPWTLYEGDCRDVVTSWPTASVDAVVTDPPYGMSFMDAGWDHQVPGPDYWRAMYRILKPGAHLVAFGGARTHHRLWCAIEDAGFEIRDTLMWIYSSGYPKSKKMDGGYGTGLKPAHEPIVLARRPLAARSVMRNVAMYGTGGLNIEACRVPCAEGDLDAANSANPARYPANVLHDGSGEVLAAFPQAPGAQAAVDGEQPSSHATRNVYGRMTRHHATTPRTESTTSAARFFYCAKASRADRDAGLEAYSVQGALRWSSGEQSPGTFQSAGTNRWVRNAHPTVKPTALMRYLCTLVTPSRGLVLDPFTGSGSTGRGAMQAGLSFVGVELPVEQGGWGVDIADARIVDAARQPDLFTHGKAADRCVNRERDRDGATDAVNAEAL